MDGVRFGGRRLVLGAAVVVSLSSCGHGNEPGAGSTGRVSGHVLAGPTCPVERPGDPTCPPTAVDGVVDFVRDGDVVSSVEIDTDGGFVDEVPAGTYTLSVDTGEAPLPFCESVEVQVLADTEVEVAIACDTGIR